MFSTSDNAEPLPKRDVLILLAVAAGVLFGLGTASRWLGFDPLFGLAERLQSLPWHLGTICLGLLAGLALVIEGFIALLLLAYLLRRDRIFYVKWACAFAYAGVFVWIAIVDQPMDEKGLLMWIVIGLFGTVNAICFGSAAATLPINFFWLRWGRRVFGDSFSERYRKMRHLQTNLKTFSELKLTSWVFVILATVSIVIGRFTGYLYVIGILAYCTAVTWAFRIRISTPPGVLFLGPSSEESLLLLDSMRRDLRELRVVYLLDTRHATSEQSKFHVRISSLDNFREESPQSAPLSVDHNDVPLDEAFAMMNKELERMQSDPDYHYWKYHWQTVVRKLIELSSVVVLDGTTDTKWLRLEALKILKSDQRDSFVLLVGDAGQSPILDHLREATSDGTSDIDMSFDQTVDEMQERLIDLSGALSQLQSNLKKPKPLREFLSSPTAIKDALEGARQQQQSARLDMPMHLATRSNVIKVVREVARLPAEPPQTF